MTKTQMIIAVVVAVFALLAVGTVTGVLTPDTSAPTYNNENGGS